MKASVAILILISTLLVSCAPATPTQENEVIKVATESSATEESLVQEPIVTEESIATESPTEMPTEPLLACVTLLTPINGAEIPPVGMVPFSWTPMDEAGNYALNIILPSGETVSFETDQTLRYRYMEAFVAGGEYQWQVVAQGKDGSEICVSEVAKFDKSAYEPPKQGESGNNGGNDSNEGGGNDGNDNGSGEVPCEDTPAGCEITQ